MTTTFEQLALDLYVKKLPVYPEVPGHRKTRTSKQAADRVASRTGQTRAAILSLIDAHGALTADECAELLGLRVLFVRPRMSELKKKGLVVESGIMRLSSEGCNMAAFERVI